MTPTPETLRQLAEKISNVGHRWRTELDAAADAWGSERLTARGNELALIEWRNEAKASERGLRRAEKLEITSRAYDKAMRATAMHWQNCLACRTGCGLCNEHFALQEAESLAMRDWRAAFAPEVPGHVHPMTLREVMDAEDNYMEADGGDKCQAMTPTPETLREYKDVGETDGTPGLTTIPCDVLDAAADAWEASERARQRAETERDEALGANGMAYWRGVQATLAPDDDVQVITDEEWLACGHQPAPNAPKEKP